MLHLFVSRIALLTRQGTDKEEKQREAKEKTGKRRRRGRGQGGGGDRQRGEGEGKDRQAKGREAKQTYREGLLLHECGKAELTGDLVDDLQANIIIHYQLLYVQYRATRKEMSEGERWRGEGAYVCVVQERYFE